MTILKRRGLPPPTDWGGRDPREPLDESRLNEILLGMQERFRWPTRANRFVVVGAWSSRTADLYRCRDPHALAPDVVLKISTGWGGDGTREAWEAMRRIDEMLRRGSACRVVPPLGWSSSPPSLCTAHIEGTDLFFMLRDLDHPRWSGSRGVPELVRECGRALGTYHAARARSEGTAEDEVARVAGTMRMSRRARQLLRAAPTADVFGDFGPHQFRVADGGELYVLDTPSGTRAAPVYLDIAKFAFGSRKILGEDSHRRAPRGLAEELCRAFYEGYSSTGPADLFAPEHRWLVEAFHGYVAAGTARKRARERRYARAVRHGSQWFGKVISSRRAVPNG